MSITTIDINIDNWVILNVCGTCEYAVGGGGEINDVSDARSAEALAVKWQEYNLWVDCGGEDCDSEHRWMCVYEGCDDPDDEDAAFGHTHEYGHHSGGFTHMSCDICGGGGHDSHRVIAEKLAEVPATLTVAVSHEITAGDMEEGDKLLVAEGVEDLPLMVGWLSHSPHSVHAKLTDPARKELPDYRFFDRNTPVTVFFAGSC
ncbi:hypothetical protein ACFOOK_26380 [Micromonospora krabiensis]|uniref:Uncharacterized protein n=1 Tax=Micromonospora krabiensis TaxID=307121 RepID=A0A1C3N5P9_9ACTN|nr:hypothetical protein [Micromonospora krabiensis]SBV27905.1 hypothetical protein GA0070620_3436 [Micromonospora krabiensis]